MKQRKIYSVLYRQRLTSGLSNIHLNGLEHWQTFQNLRLRKQNQKSQRFPSPSCWLQDCPVELVKSSGELRATAQQSNHIADIPELWRGKPSQAGRQCSIRRKVIVMPLVMQQRRLECTGTVMCTQWGLGHCYVTRWVSIGSTEGAAATCTYAKEVFLLQPGGNQHIARIACRKQWSHEHETQLEIGNFRHEFIKS